TYDLKTPAGKDFLAYILDPETGELVLEKVPSFVFELKNGQTGYRNPTVMEMVKGLPTPTATNWDQANADQWLTNQQGREPTNSTGKVLSVKDTRPTKQGWHLTMQLSPFTLTDNSYVLGDNGNKLGGKARLVLTDQTTQIAAIKDNNNATPVKNMAAGGTDWSLGTQTGNVAAYLGIEPTATAKAGQYQATATWLLTNAPK
ncbi:WxL domain-containing protein, partial [Lacticaseibacillus paracasei]|nr:putative surface cell wall-binding protein [Lacticaseibacillus casei]